MNKSILLDLLKDTFEDEIAHSRTYYFCHGFQQGVVFGTILLCLSTCCWAVWQLTQPGRELDWFAVYLLQLACCALTSFCILLFIYLRNRIRNWFL